jgi:hypothetical protein
VRDGVAYQDGGSGGKSWWAYSTDGSSWHTHELESSPLSFRMRGDTVAAVVGAGSEQQLYVGTDKALLPRPKRKMLASMVKIGEQPGSIVLVGGDDTWQTAAWSADGGETFGPDQKIVKPEFVIARSVMLGAGDSVIAATADEKQPVLVIHRAERGQPAKEVARFPYADDDYVAAINSCQSGQTIWVMASARQVVVSLDGGAAWTALPPVTLAEDGAVMHDATLTCSAGALGIRTGKEVALCDAKACAAPIPTPPAVTNYLRVTPKPELWSLGEVGSDRLVTVHRVEATLVPDRAYVLLASAMPLIYADGGFVLLDDN